MEPCSPHQIDAPFAVEEAMHSLVSTGVFGYQDHGLWSAAMKITRGRSGAIASSIRARTPGFHRNAFCAGP